MKTLLLASLAAAPLSAQSLEGFETAAPAPRSASASTTSAPATCAELKPAPALASTALQDCLNKGGAIKLMPGTYRIDKPLYLKVPGTILTSYDTNQRATLLAEPGLTDRILQTPPGVRVSGFTVSYLIFDGNRMNRTNYGACQGYRGTSSNITLIGDYFRVSHIVSRNTLCGTALEIMGGRYYIHDNLLHDNGAELGGAPGGVEPWADGITLLSCDGGEVYNNVLIDNTDVALVSGGGRNCKVRNNVIRQVRKHAFAGLHVFNFRLGGKGDHAGAQHVDNDIYSETDKLAYGLGIGPHPWEQDITVPNAGTISRNRVAGAVVNVAVDGVDAGTITDNVIGGARGTRGFLGCSKSAPYTADHVGPGVLLQGGWIRRHYHGATGCGGDGTVVACGPAQPAPHYSTVGGACLPSCGVLLAGRPGTSSGASCESAGLVSAGRAYDVPYCCLKPASVCGPDKPAPHWAPVGGACLPSCGVLLAGRVGSASSVSCESLGKVSAGRAYDVPYCCVGTGATTGACGADRPAPHYKDVSGTCLPSCGVLRGAASSVPCGVKGSAGRAYDVPYCCVP